MHTLIVRLAILFCLMAVPGYAAPLLQATETAPADRAATAFQRAVDHYRAGKLNEAAGLLRGFVISYPDSAQVASAYLYLAQIHTDLGEPDQALKYLADIPPAERSPTSRLLEGRLLTRTGQASRALQTLTELDPNLLTLTERQELWLALSEAAALNEEPHRALYFLYKGLLTEGQQTPEEILSKVHNLLDEQFSDADLEEISFLYADTPIAYQAMLKLGWRALSVGQKDLAREWATAVLEAPAGFTYRDEALSLQAQVTDPTQIQRAVGVLLPLTGRYAAFGKLVQRGMQLAQETSRPRVPVRFIYRDTAGDATQAAQQLAELAISDRVIAVTGPLVGNAAEAAAIRANQERLPLLTMSQKEGLAASSLYVFRNSLTPQLQVRALVDAALRDRGLTEFAMLTPQTRQGELFADLFRLEIEHRGGTLVTAQTYNPEQTDFRRQVRLLLGRDPDAPDDEDPAPTEKPAEKEPPPFQALFIPDYADRISLIAPQLAFYGLEGVQLLGTNGWNDPDLLRTAGRFVEGAIFTDGFFLHSHYPFVQEFVERYYTAYGEDPTILEAQGYDTAGILLNLLDNPQIKSRDDLRRSLTQLQNYPGVTGATRFDAVGEADKVLFLLQIQNGTIIQIN